MEILFFIIISVGIATGEPPVKSSEQVFAPQIVTGWQDANGKIHLKGVGGEQGFASISEPHQHWPALGWGGASR